MRPIRPMPPDESLLPPHGNYRELLSYQKAEVIYDLTFRFAHKYLAKGDRTIDQMIQSARSGKQNILEGSKAAPTSKETEIKLTNVARASLEELLGDYRDYLRVRDLPMWEKDCRLSLEREASGLLRFTRGAIRPPARAEDTSDLRALSPVFRDPSAADHREHRHLPHSPDQLSHRPAASSFEQGFRRAGRPARADDPRPAAPPQPASAATMNAAARHAFKSLNSPVPHISPLPPKVPLWKCKRWPPGIAPAARIRRRCPRRPLSRALPSGGNGSAVA
jgi:four helix bundle protein